jgi:uncharacterized membrane protein YdfJ with MMPL/SSD domain
MALSIGFGLLFATIIILFIVPALYLIFDDINRKIASLFKAKPDKSTEKKAIS